MNFQAKERFTWVRLFLIKQGSGFYTGTCSAMGRIEFPSTPINAESKVATSPAEQSPFVQPTLEGIELEQSPEIELGNCIVTTAGQIQKAGAGE